MQKKLLVTTALQNTWGKKNNIIFLGNWCEKYDNFKNLGPENYSVFEYHWDNRQKLKDDYDYLNKFYKKIFPSLKNELNKIHNTSFSDRYWKIVIGPWLITLIQIIFERYSNLKFFFEKNKNYQYETIILKYDKEKYIPKNFEQFSRLMITDTWNHFIYSLLIEFENFNFEIEKNYKEFGDEENYKNYLVEKKLPYKNKLYNNLAYFFDLMLGKKNILISESYLGRFQELSFALKFRSLPRYSINDNLKKSSIGEIRNKISLEFNVENPFEDFIKKFIFLFLPKSFLEDFTLIDKEVIKMKWPKKPKIIFSSHFMQKTLQSRYTAFSVEKNKSKLILGQHGGVYGQYLFSTMEDHELEVCDKYLSWGWKLDNPKVIPFGILKNFKEKKHDPNNEKLLMIFRSQVKYTHRINSYTGTNQIKKYFNENLNLCKNLNSDLINKNIILRFHARKFGWNEDKMFLNNFPNIRIDLGYNKILELYKKSKLILHTYIGTGYLETLAINIPTIIFANTKECMLKEETLEYLDELKKVNIFHDSYISASEFINRDWDNIHEWWASDIVQNTRKKFCTKYSKINLNKNADLYKIFNEL